jgi:hypothetical protein
MSKDTRFQEGDVFACGDSRWRVETVFRDGRAVLRSERAEWATTRPLTWDEQIDGGRFALVERDGVAVAS